MLLHTNYKSIYSRSYDEVCAGTFHDAEVCDCCENNGKFMGQMKLRVYLVLSSKRTARIMHKVILCDSWRFTMEM